MAVPLRRQLANLKTGILWLAAVLAKMSSRLPLSGMVKTPTILMFERSKRSSSTSAAKLL